MLWPLPVAFPPWHPGVGMVVMHCFPSRGLCRLLGALQCPGQSVLGHCGVTGTDTASARRRHCEGEETWKASEPTGLWQKGSWVGGVPLRCHTHAAWGAQGRQSVCVTIAARA